jgi:hypothetical protein
MSPWYAQRCAAAPPQQRFVPPPNMYQRQNVCPPPNMYPPPYANNGRSFSAKDEPAETGIIILAVITPLIGLIYGIISISNGEKRAGRTYLIAAGISFGFCLLLLIVIIAMAVLLKY